MKGDSILLEYYDEEKCDSDKSYFIKVFSHNRKYFVYRMWGKIGAANPQSKTEEFLGADRRAKAFDSAKRAILQKLNKDYQTQSSAGEFAIWLKDIKGEIK